MLEELLVPSLNGAKTELRSGIVSVNPALASEWLGANKRNRPLSEKTIARYDTLMAGGRWMVNCDAIGFDIDGNLINGQHRLHAVIKSKTTQDMLVVWGLQPRVFEVSDNGKRRGAGDCLAILGYKHYESLASAARYLYTARKNRLVDQRVLSVTVENDDIVNMVANNEGLTESVAYCNGFNNKFVGLFSVSVLTFLHFLYSYDHGNEAASFVHRLATGEGLTDGDPILLFRERMIRGMNSYEAVKKETALALAIIAFNAHVQGKGLKTLRYSPGAGQAFPQPIVPLLRST